MSVEYGLDDDMEKHMAWKTEGMEDDENAEGAVDEKMIENMEDASN